MVQMLCVSIHKLEWGVVIAMHTYLVCLQHAVFVPIIQRERGVQYRGKHLRLADLAIAIHVNLFWAPAKLVPEKTGYHNACAYTAWWMGGAQCIPS